jgi:crossover junction endodeoxyribonuclease RuvC
MLVVGIDPGTATTGYGLVRENDDGSLLSVDFGTIVTTPDQPMAKRLLELHKQLRNLLLLHRPQSGAVEKLFFQRNVRTALAVGQARGVALLAMAECNLHISEYTPLEVKQAVVGYGGADKKQIQHMVAAILSLPEPPKQDDAADALAVAICHIHSARLSWLHDNQS